MGLLKLPLANTWNLDDGLEVIGNAIRLAIGSGGWNANTLEMTELPPSPWVAFGTEFAGIIDGELLEIIDDSGSTFKDFRLGPGAYGLDLSVGFTLYVKVRALVWTGSFANYVVMADGNNRYNINFKIGSIEIAGLSTHNHDVAKYPWVDIFISVVSNVASFWIFNPITNKWDLLRSGLSSTSTAYASLDFGSGSTVALGHSFWDFFRFKSAIEATPYRTTGLVGEMASAEIYDKNIDQLDILETVGSGSNILWQYDIGSGYNGVWITLAAMRVILIDTDPATYRLKFQVNTDGVTPASVDLNGTQSVIGADSAGDYPVESDVRFPVEYSNGAFTGTLKPFNVVTDPNDTLRQRIVDVLTTRLATITIAKGYKTNSGNSVHRWQEFGISKDNLPAIVYSDTFDNVDQGTVGKVDHVLTVDLQLISSRNTEDTEDEAEQEIREIIADLNQMVGTDTTWSDLAEATALIDDVIEMEQLENKQWGATVSVNIDYRTDRFNAYS